MRKGFKARWAEIVTEWRDYPLQPGKGWGSRYVIERFLGMGSYGQAYACRDRASGELVLLKRNKPSKGNTGIRLLRREYRIMQSACHPQMPKALDYSVMGKQEALVMEYIEGYNLEYAIYEQNQTFGAEEALRLLKQLMQPLKQLHAAGYVHRDVRIPNVLIREGRPHLIDLGLACAIGEELPADLRMALGEDGGPPGDSAAALKQRMRNPYPSSDWFGLGHLFLFAMYAGYEAEEDQAEQSWEEELCLQPEVRVFIRKLLNDDTAWPSTEACELELDKLIASLAAEA
ncbi:protein kinase [Paenibacillus sp. LHD-117]|uniref:serine/threonine protein kinase n=1 Tax=Paenibacillus sp. LHD-117 TaxID=3071412 RepID=UPI0027E11B6C|nr:protein kinase [Paenibacillus sp. LHD-117]MDQ6423184.1 protein kinase [Paenibacillus sp. LHD-117]